MCYSSWDLVLLSCQLFDYLIIPEIYVVAPISGWSYSHAVARALTTWWENRVVAADKVSGQESD